ncbi:MAG: DUF2950 domain-containing protein [Steroidobacteraceae bacterium]
MANRQESQALGQPLLALLLALCIATGVVTVATAASPIPVEASFATPQQAVDALVSATRGGRTAALARILGPAGVSLIRSGDAVADRSARRRFVAAYDNNHRIERQGSAKAVLSVGAENWPMPIPLVHTASGWQFDTAAGREEILDRRIGRDELAVIQVCRAYVEAQREYAELTVRSGAGAEYAQHFISRGGAHNGLYWPTRSGEPQSPLGPLVAQARAGGYSPGGNRVKPHPYYGYYFRILTGQGPHASGGAKSYLIDGRMTGGFALLAYPAEYGDSGVMTFMVSRNGIVFEKNLGPQTAAIAAEIKQYDPDGSWSPPT